MNHLTTYQVNALRTEKPLPTALERLHHAALGFITETGEIATEVKRMAIYGKPLDDERALHIAEEIGDVMWYLAIASDALGKDIFRGLMADLTPREGLSLQSETERLALSVGYFITGIYSGELNQEDRDYLTDQILPELAQGLVDLASLVNIPIDLIAGANIDKLRARFPDAYSNEAAEARADKGGLDARNS